MISRGKTDLMTLGAFWTLPFFQVYITCFKNWTCPSLQVEIEMGSYSAHSIMNLMSPVHLKVERETIAEFLCLGLEDVKVPKRIQVNYNIPSSESSEVFVEKY